MRQITYTFRTIEHCDMCRSSRTQHLILGMRLNRSQGFRPKSVDGIAVSVKQCRACGLIFSDPQPVPANLSDHYGMPPEEYWDSHEAHWDWTPEYFSREIAIAKNLLPFRTGMKALDVGVGLGKCMRSLKHAGFDAWGIEPSQPFHERAISKMRLNPERVTLSTVEDADFPENTFDFISFGAVLEHLYSPSLALQRAVKWLKPEGLIQVEVPSSAYSISKLANLFFWLRGTNYVTNISPMHAPFHLYEFSLRSFEKNGALTGYDVAHHYYMLGAICHVPKLFHPAMKWWMNYRKTGMQLTVFLRKLAAA